MIDEDRLTTAPQQARTCPNCACPVIGGQCLACHYSFPDDDDADDDDTELLPPVLDLGGSD